MENTGLIKKKPKKITIFLQDISKKKRF